MANTLLTTLTKSLGAKIAWIGGAAAGITALFSALGFLALKGHHDLLGISGLVPTGSDAWTIEGAKFAYTTAYLLLAGCWNRPTTILAPGLGILLLVALASSTNALRRLRRVTQRPAAQLALILLTVAALFLALGAMIHELAARPLLIAPSEAAFTREILPRTTTEGMETLAFRYAAYAMLTALLAVWLHLLPLLRGPADESTPETAGPPAWQAGLWGLFFFHLLLLPILYGQLVKGHDYFKVCLLPAIEADATAPCAGPQGWLLHKGPDEIALYVAAAVEKPIQVFKQKEFTQIQALAYDNVMKAVPPPAAAGSGANPPAATLSLGGMPQFLRALPDTFAAGIRPMARTLADPLKVLVLANDEGQTLNTFAAFGEESGGFLHAPLILPGSERILYGEVANAVPRLKTIAINLDPSTVAPFGDPPLEGWEPRLTPDGQFIILRQGTSRLVRVDLDGRNATPLVEDANLGQLIGAYAEDGAGEYALVYTTQQDNRISYRAARVQGDTVIPLHAPLDERVWRLARYIRIHDGRMLYEQEDEMPGEAGDGPPGSGVGTQMVFNIYLSDAAASPGERITNTYPGAALYQNRAPAWSMDGRLIVYLSSE